MIIKNTCNYFSLQYKYQESARNIVFCFTWQSSPHFIVSYTREVIYIILMTPKVPDVFQTPSFGRQASLLYDITYLLDCLRATFEGFPVITCPKAHQDKRCSYHGTLGPITEDDLPFLCGHLWRYLVASAPFASL